MRVILPEGVALDVVSEKTTEVTERHGGANRTASWIDDCCRARPSSRRARPPSRLRHSPLRSRPRGARSPPPAIAGDPDGRQRWARGDRRPALPRVRGRRAPTRRLVVVGRVSGGLVERTPRGQRDRPRGIHCAVIALGGCAPGSPVVSICSGGTPRARKPDTPVTRACYLP